MATTLGQRLNEIGRRNQDPMDDLEGWDIVAQEGQDDSDGYAYIEPD